MGSANISSRVRKPSLNSRVFSSTLKSWSMVIMLLGSISGISSVASSGLSAAAFVRLKKRFGSEIFVAVILLRVPSMPYDFLDSLWTLDSQPHCNFTRHMEGTYHPFEPHPIPFGNTVQVCGWIQSQRITNRNLSLAAEVGDGSVQALMENTKKLNIIHVVQGLSKGLFRPFISNVGSQYSRHIDLLAWLDRSWKFQWF